MAILRLRVTQPAVINERTKDGKIPKVFQDPLQLDIAKEQLAIRLEKDKERALVPAKHVEARVQEAQKALEIHNAEQRLEYLMAKYRTAPRSAVRALLVELSGVRNRLNVLRGRKGIEDG